MTSRWAPLAFALLLGCSGVIGSTGGAGGGSAAGGSGGGSAGGGMAGGGAGGGAATGGGAAGGGAAGGGGGATGGGGAVGGGTGGGAAGGGSGGGAAGGSGGGAGGGGALDAGPSCSAAFCDDFERPDGGGLSPWRTSVSGGTVALDTARAHSGTTSAKITTDGQAAYRRAYLELTSPFFPVSGNAFYGRMWVYLTAAPSMTTHWTNISGEGTAQYNGQNIQAYVRYGGQVSKQLMANYDSSPLSSDCWRHSTVAIPEGRWACFEWHFAGGANTMELWLDGTQLNQITINGTGDGCIAHDLADNWVLPTFDTLHLGWEHYQTSIPIEMWVDDVALDTSQIGCQ